MNKQSILKWGIIVLIAAAIIGAGMAYYMFNRPHRDIGTTKADSALMASDLVSEFLINYDKATELYLSDDGDSKILEVTGTVVQIDEDYEGNTVILLKSASDKAGVSCTLMAEEKAKVSSVQLNTPVTIKGVIRAGAAYDEDLDMYENVIIEKGSLVL